MSDSDFRSNAPTNAVDTPVTRALARVLADTYTLQLKTQNYHWNVEGPHFHALHTLFEGQYKVLAEAVDDVAERIRTLGAYAPGSFAEFAELAAVKPATGRLTAGEMVTDLLAAQQDVIDGAKAGLATAEAAEDAPTADLLTQRIAAHEKTAWMLRSIAA